MDVDLSVEAFCVYKKKTEIAKKQYLKQLAAYRASQVSQSATQEAKKAPSPSGLENVSVGNVPGTFSFQTLGATPVPDSQVSPLSMMGQMMGQQRQQQSSPHVVQMSPQVMQQQHQLHHHQQQQLLQQISMGRILPLSPSHQQHPPSQQQLTLLGPMYTCPPHAGQAGPISYQPTINDHSVFGLSDIARNMDGTYPQCIGADEGNHIRANPGWDSENYSNDYVTDQCRDVITKWAVSRPSSNIFPVK